MNHIESPLAIANYFIQKANDECLSMTPMKLLKLVYISHGWHLAVYNTPLIEEPILAWQYGPVVPSVYQQFKIYGNTNITDTGFIINAKREMQVPIPEKSKWDFLDKVWNVYKNFTGIELSAMTHRKNTPWDIIYNSGHGENNIIPNSLIMDHYVNKISSNQSVGNVS